MALHIAGVADLVQSQYGVSVVFDESDAGAVANIADSVLVRSTPHCVALTIVNQSANQMYVRAMAPASAARGLWIPANGGTLILGWRDDLTLPALEWHIVAGADGSPVYYQRLLLVGSPDVTTPVVIGP